MRIRPIATIVACTFLLALLQLVAGFWMRGVGIACGAIIALLSFVLFRFFELEFHRAWLYIVFPVTASLAGVGLTMLGNPQATSDFLWLAPALAAATAGVVLGFQRISSRRCGLCNGRIGGDVSFNCPRCGLLVCERNCWVFEQSRCRLCEQNRVPIFSPDARWWDKHLGPRTRYGRCLLCQSEGEQADLRACGRCGRPQCRECWDYSNGQCSRCQWTVDDLPEPLREYILTPAAKP